MSASDFNKMVDPTFGGGKYMGGNTPYGFTTEDRAKSKYAQSLAAGRSKVPAYSHRHRGSGQQILKFPENLGTDPTQGNYMQFTFKEIAAAGGNRSGSRGADPRNLVFKAAHGWPIICLPIPSGLNEAYQQNWDVAQVAGRHAMLAEHGATTINAMGQFIADRGRRKGAINEFVGDIQGSAGAAGTAREGETLLQRAGRIIGNTTAELGGMALTSNLVELGDIARVRSICCRVKNDRSSHVKLWRTWF